MPTLGDASSAPIIDLAGAWSVRLDRDSIGEAHGWYLDEWAEDRAEIELPGSIQAQGIGDEVSVDTPWVGMVVDDSYFVDDKYAPYREPGNIKVPFWLQPARYYIGEAWFQRTIVVPEQWAGAKGELLLERVHWESTVWIDDRRVGSERSLTTAHRFSVGALAPGEHRVTIRVDNRMIVNVGPNSHSVSDHTQGNWNGIIGRLALQQREPVRIASIETFPDVAARMVRVRVNIESDARGAGRGALRVSAECVNTVTPHRLPTLCIPFDFDYPNGLAVRGLTAGGGHVDLAYDLGEQAQTWDEFRPALYRVTVELESTVGGEACRAASTTTFGLREVSAVGTQIRINDRPAFLRGTLESCVFPLTGYPPTDCDSWSRIFARCQEFGINHVRFHSWCPPEAAFDAADEAGMYIQVEGPLWANQGSAIGERRDVDAFMYEESWRIVEAYGNHPSFIMMAHGNEPFGRDAEILAEWVTYWRKRDSRRLYTSGAGWPAIDESDFDSIPEPRIQKWGDGLESRINGALPETMTDYADWVTSRPRPIITHEMGQWCSYPDFAEIDKYTGFMRAANFEIFRDFLSNAGLDHMADAFVYASGRLQVLCYKEEIETALRTPGFGGFQLLGLTDFPGQGSALVGVLDAFWDPKSYITAREFSQFCSTTVPLARMDRRTWTTDEEMRIELQIAHFGPRGLEADIRWELTVTDGAVVASGSLPATRIGIGNEERHGTVAIPLSSLTAPTALVFSVSVVEEGVVLGHNQWNVWAYPPVVTGALPAGPVPLVTRDADSALTALRHGTDVLLIARSDDVISDVAFGFSTVFWNTAWTSYQPPRTLGIVCDPEHPVFDAFPTDGHTDWQWWEVLHGARTVHLNRLSTSVEPLVGAIDTWFDAERLAMLVEARFGNARLMLCTMDIDTDLASRVVARQLRASILNYMTSDLFRPTVEFAEEDISRLVSGVRDKIAQVD